MPSTRETYRCYMVRVVQWKKFDRWLAIDVTAFACGDARGLGAQPSLPSQRVNDSPSFTRMGSGHKPEYPHQIRTTVQHPDSMCKSVLSTVVEA